MGVEDGHKKHGGMAEDSVRRLVAAFAPFSVCTTGWVACRPRGRILCVEHTERWQRQHQRVWKDNAYTSRNDNAYTCQLESARSAIQKICDARGFLRSTRCIMEVVDDVRRRRTSTVHKMHHRS